MAPRVRNYIGQDGDVAILDIHSNKFGVQSIRFDSKFIEAVQQQHWMWDVRRKIAYTRIKRYELDFERPRVDLHRFIAILAFPNEQISNITLCSAESVQLTKLVVRFKKESNANSSK